MQIFVNRYPGSLPMTARKVSRLGNSFFTEMKVKWLLLPQGNAIVQCGTGYMRLQMTSD